MKTVQEQKVKGRDQRGKPKAEVVAGGEEEVEENEALWLRKSREEQGYCKAQGTPSTKQLGWEKDK